MLSTLKKDFITFTPRNDIGKTKVFDIHANKSWDLLGNIKFVGAVKAYALYPVEGMFFDKKNLGDILNFLDELNKERETTTINLTAEFKKGK